DQAFLAACIQAVNCAPGDVQFRELRPGTGLVGRSAQQLTTVTAYEHRAAGMAGQGPTIEQGQQKFVWIEPDHQGRARRATAHKHWNGDVEPGHIVADVPRVAEPDL